jgi:hypothetical protein
MYPVHADFIAGEVVSTRLGFDDYSRMQTAEHKLNAGRRYATPPWSHNDMQIAEVIARFMEVRAMIGHPRRLSGTSAERLAQAQQLLIKQRPELMARVDKLCREYMAAKDTDVSRANFVSQKVEEADTQLRILESVPLVLAGCIHFYWRCGYDSVETARQLRLKPPHVRRLLHRLCLIADKLGYKTYELAPPRCSQKEKRQFLSQEEHTRKRRFVTHAAERKLEAAGRLAQVIDMRKAGLFTTQIAEALGLDKATGCEVVRNLLIKAGLK